MKLKLRPVNLGVDAGAVSAIPWGAQGLSDWLDRFASSPASQISHGSVDLASVDRAGGFRLIFADLIIRRPADRAGISIPWFTTEVSITPQDLESGTADIELAPEGMFEVTVIGRNGEPLPNRRLQLLPALSNIQASGRGGLSFFSMSVAAGGQGTFLALGNPCMWGIQLDSETGLKIAPI